MYCSQVMSWRVPWQSLKGEAVEQLEAAPNEAGQSVEVRQQVPVAQQRPESQC